MGYHFFCIKINYFAMDIINKLSFPVKLYIYSPKATLCVEKNYNSFLFLITLESSRISEFFTLASPVWPCDNVYYLFKFLFIKVGKNFYVIVKMFFLSDLLISGLGSTSGSHNLWGYKLTKLWMLAEMSN